MATKVVHASGLKPGSYVLIDGEACKVLSSDTSKSGKHGHAKVRIVASTLLGNKRKEIVMPAHDNLESPIIEKKSAQVLSISDVDGKKMANVMDQETYETFDLEIPEELLETVVPNSTVLYWNVMGEKVMKQLKSGAEE